MTFVDASKHWYLFPFRLFFLASGMYAITISSSTCVCRDSAIAASASVRVHEAVHMRQFRVMGWFGFVLAYIAESILHGYAKNRFELEAYRVEDEVSRISSRAKVPVPQGQDTV